MEQFFLDWERKKLFFCLRRIKIQSRNLCHRSSQPNKTMYRGKKCLLNQMHTDARWSREAHNIHHIVCSVLGALSSITVIVCFFILHSSIVFVFILIYGLSNYMKKEKYTQAPHSYKYFFLLFLFQLIRNVALLPSWCC